ncbi:MAG: hypothetical protein KC589_09195 [Nanoarchaeota archaeon]|nr:hypothetical protein [Nanoarchaeota archaeon]
MFILSFILVVLFTPLGMTYTLIKTVLLLDFSYINDYYRKLSISLDQFGNVVMSGFFNVILIKSSSSYKFGNPDETISSVLGKNKLINCLTKLGTLLDMLLNKFDNNHSINSIEHDEKGF